MSLRFRYLILLVPALLLVWGAFVYSGFKKSEHTVMLNIHRQGYEHGLTQSREFQVLMESCRRSAKGLAMALEDVDRMDEARIQALMDRVLEENASVFGSAIALIPGETRLGRFSTYAYRGAGDHVLHKSLSADKYGYEAWGWFWEPVQRKSGVWAEPYFDEGGGDILMTTYSTPITVRGRIVGVATVDVGLDYLEDKLTRLASGPGELAFVLSHEQRVIGSPSQGFKPCASLEEQGFASKGAFVTGLRGLLQDPPTGITRLPHPRTTKPAWVLVAPIRLSDRTPEAWHLVAVFPEEYLMRDLHGIRVRLVLLSVLGLGLLGLMLFWFAYGVAGPMEHLVAQAERYAGGHYAETLDEQQGFLEIRRLSQAFNRMGCSILEQLEAVRVSALQTESYQRELRFASEIQGRILPQVFPPFPDLVDRMDLYGLSRAAREMGGDFFDFVREDRDHVCLVIADVSDKGAASALFAAMTRTLLQTLLERGLRPEEAMRRTNLLLCRQNPGEMFVTALLVRLDTRTGQGRLVSAGHDAPLVLSPSGEVRVLPCAHAMPLAAMGLTRYESHAFALQPGETLVAYTDGVTEAQRGEDGFYGPHRLKGLLPSLRGRGSRGLCEGILEDVKAYQGDGEQADDITLVALQWHAAAVAAPPSGPTRVLSLEVPVSRDSLALLAAVAAEQADEAGLDERAAGHVQLALEELAMNLVMHGGEPPASFLVRFTTAAGELRLDILDFGAPYDFEQASTRYSGVPDVDGPPGGVGLFLVKKVMDEVHYEPGTLEGNRMTLVKRVSRSENQD